MFANNKIIQSNYFTTPIWDYSTLDVSENSLISKINESKPYSINYKTKYDESYLKNFFKEYEIGIELDISTDDKIKEYFSKAFIDSIQNEDLEFGMFGHTTELVKKFLSYNKDLILSELQNLVLQNFDNKRIVYSAIHTFAHLDYEIVYPQGPIFALGMSRHKDADIQDFSIQCFEMWCSKDSLNYLEQISIDTPWLDEYLKNTIEYIKDSQ